MLVGCVGLPGSGKTTAAAEVFVGLKKAGFTAEFVVEVARQHIASKRKKAPGQPLELTDIDQLQIALGQESIESLMNDEAVIVVSDSCVLNAWLYMSPEAQAQFVACGAFKHNLLPYDMLIHVVGDQTVANDPHRAHGAEHVSHLQAQEERLMALIEEGDVPVIEHRKGSPVDSIVWRLVDLQAKAN
jgi:predicted ATPase